MLNNDVIVDQTPFEVLAATGYTFVQWEAGYSCMGWFAKDTLF